MSLLKCRFCEEGKFMCLIGGVLGVGITGVVKLRECGGRYRYREEGG